MKITHLVLATGMVLGSSSAMALFDVSAQLGKRWAKDKDGDEGSLNGIETVVSAHINPIPLPIVSLGFGASMGLTQWDSEDFKSQTGFLSVDKLSTLDMGLEVMASASIPFLAEPYVKLNYTLASVYAVEGKGTIYDDNLNTSSEEKIVGGFKGSGLSYSLGLKSSPFPLVSFLFELKRAQIKYSTDEYKEGSEDLKSAYDDFTFVMDSVLIGVEVGL